MLIPSSPNDWVCSTGISSIPGLLFLSISLRACYTSLCNMSGLMSYLCSSNFSVVTGSLLYSSSVYSFHLALTCSPNVSTFPCLSLTAHTFVLKLPVISFLFLYTCLVSHFPVFSSISLQM